MHEHAEFSTWWHPEQELGFPVGIKVIIKRNLSLVLKKFYENITLF